jgi:O-antigen/teichoic acid export membrane protein
MSFANDLLKTKPADLFRNPVIRKNVLNSFYYFGGTFVQFLIAIITQPIYSRYLELQDFAIMGYFAAVQAILYPLFSMTLPFYYLAKYWKIENGETPQKNLSFILNFLNISNGLIAIISFVLVSIYFRVFNVSIPLTPFLFIVLAQLFFEKYKSYYLIDCRVQKNGFRFFLINILQIALNTGFSLYFVVLLKSGAAGRMSGVLSGVIITGLIALIVLIREKKYFFSLKIDGKKVKPALKYCIPLIIASYAYYPIGNIDRIFLERLGNISEYGYYSIGLTISGFAGTFFLALYQSFEPDLYKFISQKKYKQYTLFTFFYILVLGTLSLIFIIFSESVVSFLTSGRYTHASSYANIFIIGIFFMQIGGVFEQLFTAYGATKLVMWRNILMGIFCVITYYFMIQHYQFQGANISRVITSIFYLISGALMFFIYIKRKKHEIVLPVSDFGKKIGAGSILD